MNRPPHIDPRWWAAASWPAKEQARRDYRATQRRAATVDQLRATVEEARAIHETVARVEPTPEAVAQHYSDTDTDGAQRLAAAYAEAYGYTQPEPDEPYEPEPLPRRWVDRIPHVEEMLALGRAPEEIVAAFGITLNSAQKSLCRIGRPDLARAFWRTLEAQRRHPCADCPTLVHRESTRCRSCASVESARGRGEVAA